MKDPKCEVCGRWLTTSNRWIHERDGCFATSNAVVGTSNEGLSTSNRKQGWEREKYNEYMRAYMARRRKEARNGDH